jgi:hypothetical protein
MRWLGIEALSNHGGWASYNQSDYLSLPHLHAQMEGALGLGPPGPPWQSREERRGGDPGIETPTAYRGLLATGQDSCLCPKINFLSLKSCESWVVTVERVNLPTVSPHTCVSLITRAP